MFAQRILQPVQFIIIHFRKLAQFDSNIVRLSSVTLLRPALKADSPGARPILCLLSLFTIGLNKSGESVTIQLNRWQRQRPRQRIGHITTILNKVFFSHDCKFLHVSTRLLSFFAAQIGCFTSHLFVSWRNQDCASILTHLELVFRSRLAHHFNSFDSFLFYMKIDRNALLLGVNDILWAKNTIDTVN